MPVTCSSRPVARGPASAGAEPCRASRCPARGRGRRARGPMGSGTPRRGTIGAIMALSIRRPRARDSGPGVNGSARVDRRTKTLTKRLQPGDIAVIDHSDLDKVSADALVAARPAAVVNASASISGRYPNLGPQILVDAGIPVLDDAGPEVMRLAD